MKRTIQAFIASCLAITLLNIPVFAQPTTTPTHDGGGISPVNLPKPVKPLPQVDIQPVAEIQPLPEPQPAPVVQTPAPAAQTASAGCVTGYTSGDYYLDKIIAYESGGRSCATNPGGCFGLLQACPGEPLREACGGDPACQIEWFQANKTGGRSWAQVWQHELDYGWW